MVFVKVESRSIPQLHTGPDVRYYRIRSRDMRLRHARLPVMRNGLSLLEYANRSPPIAHSRFLEPYVGPLAHRSSEFDLTQISGRDSKGLFW